jgi:hypothetical protein
VHIPLEIAILVFPIFAAYALRVHGITGKLAEAAAAEQEGLKAAQLQKILAPPSQAFSLWVAVLLSASVLGLGFHLLPWYLASVAFLGSFLLILLMNYLIPSERTKHYLAVILKHLKKKAEHCEAEEDPEGAQAIRDLMARVEAVAAKRNLFDEKATGY